MMGSEEHVLNKKLISGSVRTANGAHMKMLCEGDINVDVITKNGDVTSGTLRVKVILPLFRNTCNSFDHIKNLHSGIPKPEKNHTGPFSIHKRT